MERTSVATARVDPETPKYDKSSVLPVDPHYDSSILPAEMNDEEDGYYESFERASSSGELGEETTQDRRMPLDRPTLDLNKESLRAMAEAEEFFASGRQARFSAADDMISSLRD